VTPIHTRLLSILSRLQTSADARTRNLGTWVGRAHSIEVGGTRYRIEDENGFCSYPDRAWVDGVLEAHGA